MMNSEAKKLKIPSRDRLIAASLKLFSNKGYHGCSIREICDKANANISLISFHFGGKEGLLDAIFDKLVEQDFNKIELSLSAPTSKEDVLIRLDHFLNSYIDFSIKHSDVIGLYLEELERGNPQTVDILPKTYGKIWNSLTSFLKEAQDKNLISEDLDANITAFQILAPINHLIRSKRSTNRTTTFSLEDGDFRKKFLSQMSRFLN
jgi:AcrR family transcriptional regulator